MKSCPVAVSASLSRLQKLARLCRPDEGWRRCGYPIDAVVTWVDGEDPRFCQERAHYGGAGLLSAEAARFTSYAGVEFVLFSLLRMLPWIRRIYVVTAFGQRPRLAELLPKRVVVVDHARILPAAVLPTFNSQAIECGLAELPGLSERFLYANDDTFVGRPLSHRDFIDGWGRIRLRHDFARAPRRPSDHHYLGSIARSEACLDRCFGPAARWMIHHQVRMVTRTGLRRAAALFPEEWQQTLASRFRAGDNISPMHVAHYVDCYDGRGRVSDDLLSALCYTDDQDFADKLQAIEQRRPFLFCINDGDHYSPANHRLAREFLQRYYLAGARRRQ